MVVDVLNGAGITGDVPLNITESLSQVISPFMGILQAVGIAFIIYVCYLIIKGVLDWKNRSRIKNIEERVEEIDKKLDLLVKKKK